MFIGLTIAWWILDIIAGMGIATSWASNYIATLQGIISAFDTIILFTFAVLFGAVIIRSYRLKTHPVLGVVGLIAIPAAVLATGYASNLVAIFTNLPFLGSALNQFPYTLQFIKNSPAIIGAASILGAPGYDGRWNPCTQIA
uniref:Hypothetical membrane protein n=1 Tax=uncultured virus TaxID=340016 RepID=D5L2J1_9VIRU|nr:hypothetical membrane protein [uncultured virus]